MTWQSDPNAGWNPPATPAQPAPGAGPAQPPAHDPYAAAPQAASPGGAGPQELPYTQVSYAPPAPYAQAPDQSYGQQPFGQQPFGQPPYGQPPYGQPAAWGGPRPIDHARASKRLLGVSVFMLAIAALGTLAGALTDTYRSVDRYALLLSCVLLLVTSGTTLGLTIGGRRRADRGSGGLLMAAGVLAIVLGGFGILGAVASLASGAGAGGLLGGLLYLAAGIGVVRAVRR